MIAIVNCGSSKTPDISDCLTAFGVPSRIFNLSELSLIPGQSQLKGIIISGAPILLTSVDQKEYVNKFSNLFLINVPILGICFGHQIIGLHFGATVTLMQPCRKTTNISLTQNSELLNHLPTSIVMLQDHTEEISLPEKFRLLATSNYCQNEAMEHQDLPVFGVQFHPESSGDHGKVLLKNFCITCKTLK